MLKGISLLIFDLDGTLLDSKTDIANAINKTLVKYNLPAMSEDIVWSYLGDGASYLVNRCFQYYRKEPPEASVEFFVKEYEDHATDFSKLYPNVLSTLTALSKFKKAILTNKPSEITEKICKELNFAHFFDLIVGGDQYKKKPDPEGVLHILNHLGVEARKTAILGDTTIDLLAGKKAGIKRIAATWGVHPREVLAEEKPDLIIDDFPEILKLVSN